MINAVFRNDPQSHIFEIQIYHKDLLTVRKDIGGHEGYSKFRAGKALADLLGVRRDESFSFIVRL